MGTGLVPTATNRGVFDPMLVESPVPANGRPTPAVVDAAERLATRSAAGDSRDGAEVGAAAVSSGVSDPPHAASEMHSESTLNDMRRGGSGAEVIICGQAKQEAVVSDGHMTRPRVTRTSVRGVSEPTVSALRDAWCITWALPTAERQTKGSAVRGRKCA